MQITGSKFKVDELGDAAPAQTPPAGDTAVTSDGAPVTADAQLEETNSSIESWFGSLGGVEAGAGTAPANNANPLDDYTMGEFTQAGAVVDVDGAGTKEWLKTFPPTLEKLREQKPGILDNYLDLVAAKYNQAKEDILTLDTELAKKEGKITNALELNEIRAIRGLVAEALTRCNEQLERLGPMATELQETYIREMRTMQDLNGDNWIGRPGAITSYGIVRNADGTTAYVDINGKAVKRPLMDAQYAWQVTKDDSLKIVAPDAEEDHERAADFDDSIHQNEETGHWEDASGRVDIFLQLKPHALTNDDHNFDCPIDIGIPEYLWVERNPDGTAEFPYKTDAAGDMILFNEWNDTPDNGISQVIPEDLSKYMQVQVAKATLTSCASGKTAPDGTPLYHHYMEFRDAAGSIISRMRIEGFKAESGFGGLISNGYVAASSVGLSLNGDQRANPIELDAHSLESTGRHVISDFTGTTGTTAPIGIADDQPDAYALHKSIFEDTAGITSQQYLTGDGHDGDWEDVAHAGTGITSGRDRFISDSTVGTFDANSQDTLLGVRSGVFMTGLRGVITGTNYNDMIITPDANWESEYVQSHIPEDRERIRKGDPFYSNVVKAGLGNNVVIAKGPGDNVIMDATFVKITGSETEDINWVGTPDLVGVSSTGTLGADTRNPMCYIDAPDAILAMPDEFPSFLNDTERERGLLEDESDPENIINTVFEGGVTGDDTIMNVRGVLPIEGKPIDADAPTGTDLSMSPQSMKDGSAEIEASILAELAREPEVDQAVIGASWDDVLGQASELQSEMDDFFGQMFGGLDGMFADTDIESTME